MDARTFTSTFSFHVDTLESGLQHPGADHTSNVLCVISCREATTKTKACPTH